MYSLNTSKKEFEGKPIRKINSDSIVYKNDFQNLVIHKGKKVLEENKFFSNLDKLMQDKDFRDFYDQYFKSYTDIQTVILYMKLYQTLEDEYEKRFNEKIPKELLAFTMKEIFVDNKMRKITMESFNNFMNNYEDAKKNNFLLDIFKKIDCIEDILMIDN
jgi:hypothetical protein